MPQANPPSISPIAVRCYWAAGTVALQTVALLAGPALAVGETRLVAVWFCAGALAGLLLCRPFTEWWWLVTASFAAPLLLGLAGANGWFSGEAGRLLAEQLTLRGTLLAIVTALALALWVERLVVDRNFSNLRDALVFSAGLLLIAAISSALRTLAFPMLDSKADAFATAQRWFLAKAIGQVTVVPLLLGVLRPEGMLWQTHHLRRTLLEGVLIGLAIGAYTVFVLNGARMDDQFVLRFPHWLFIFFLWSTLRVPLPLVMAHFLVAILLSLPQAIPGQGPFGAIATTDATTVFRLQAFFLICLLTALPIKAILTQFEREQERARRSLDRLELILQEANVSWWEWNFRTNEARYSGRWKAQLGYAEHELLSEVDVWESRLHPEDRAHALTYNARYIRDPQPLYELEFRLRHRDGSYRWIMSRAKLYPDDDGQPAWVRGIHIDITERVAAQERLRDRERQLAHATRLTTMGELVAGMAHELSQPLYAIGNFCQAARSLLDRPDGVDREQIKQAVQGVEQATKQASAIILRTRNYVRYGVVERASTDVNVVIKNSVELIGFEARRRQVRLQLELATELPQLPADPVQLEQVFVNLIMNACEAVDQPTINDRRVTIASRVEADAIVVTVADNGPGIPPESQEAIFAAFQSSKTHGLGLGLAISRTLVEAHGGNLSVGAAPGGGARFSVTLPYRTPGTNAE